MQKITVKNIINIYDDERYNWVVGQRKTIEVLSVDGNLIELKVNGESIYVLARDLRTAIINATNL